MFWTYLFIAGLFECAWAVGLKYTDGFTRPAPIVFTAVTMALSLWLLGLAMRAIPIGTAYAIWTGIGAIGVALFGIIFLGESRELLRLLCLLLILIGIIGLRLTASS